MLSNIGELDRLFVNFDLDRTPAIGKFFEVDVGAEKTASSKRCAPQVVCFRGGISCNAGLISDGGAYRSLLAGLKEIENVKVWSPGTMSP